MAEPIKIPIVECHGGPLDGYVTRWPMLGGEPSPSVVFEYAAAGPDGEVDATPDEHMHATYLYVDRARAVWRGLRHFDSETEAA